MRFVKLYRRIIEVKFTEIIISFYSSSSTSNQWRKLKNLWFPGKTIFCPNYPSCLLGDKFTQLTPRIIILYLAEPDKLKKLPYYYWDFLNQDLLSLYGQYLSTTTFTLVDHMDVKKAYDFFMDDQIIKSNSLKIEEISFCCYFLPSFYFCFSCVPAWQIIK
nr:ribosomal protein L10 [Balanophora reflexa]